MLSDSRPVSTRYQHYLSQINRHFQLYHKLLNGESDDGNLIVLHFTSKQLLGFPRILDVCQTDSVDSPLSTTEFEQFYSNVQQLRNLKVTCVENFCTDLRCFGSVEHLHLIGPYANMVKGLRPSSSHLRHLIVQNCDVTVQKLISDCCLDQSGPMSWPCLVSLKLSHCHLNELGDALKLLPSLEELDVSENDLSTIGKEVWCLENLTRLDFSFNKLKVPPQFQGMARWQLQVLHLAYNELSSIEGLHAAENLKQLDISYNLFTSHAALQPLRHLCHLEELSLLGNPMTCHKKHRLLSLQSVSPASIKPSFILDGASLTKDDLKGVMYTPVATTLTLAVGPNFASINSLEPERYDVSMSSAPSAARRHRDVRSLHGSSSVPSIKQPVQMNSNQRLQSHPFLTVDRRPENSDAFLSVSPNVDRDSILFGTPRSDNSSYLATADFESESEGSCVESARSEEGDGVEDMDEPFDTYSCQEEVGDDHAVYDQQNSPSHGDGIHIAFSRIEAITLETEEENITPPLHVRRELTESTEGPNSWLEPNEVYVAATQDHLIERDIETGKILEKLELSTVGDVYLIFKEEVSILDAKFTYLQKNRRTRRYTVIDKGAEEAAQLLFRELESYLVTNRSLKKQDYVCLKCSQTFQMENQNSGLDSYSLRNLPTTSGDIYGLSTVKNKFICYCGSDLIVEAEAKPSATLVSSGEKDESDLLSSGDKDECEEATEASIESSSKPLPIKGERTQDISRPAGHAGTSLSWIHSMQAIGNISKTFDEGPELGRSSLDQHHLSSSLPSDLSASITVRPNVGVTPAFHKSNYRNTPFKTFTHLLSAHDLYKLVDVTPSINICGVRNFPSTAAHPLEGKYSHSVTPGYLRHEHCELVATSTPRRRASLPLMDFSTSFSEARNRITAAGNRSSVFEGNRNRALNFDSVVPDPECELYEQIEYFNWSGLTVREQSLIPEQLKCLIMEEILEAEEELCAVVSACVITKNGKVLSSMDRKARLGRSANSSIDSYNSSLEGGNTSKDRSESFNGCDTDGETEVLLVLTTHSLILLHIPGPDWQSLETLKCTAVHSHCSLVGLEPGLCSLMLYFSFLNENRAEVSQSSIGKLFGKKSTFKMSSLGEVYAARFPSSDICERFYVRWRALLDADEEEPRRVEWHRTDSGMPKHNGMQEDSRDASLSLSNFSDALEKNFSEYILMYLDLGSLDIDSAGAHSVTAEMLVLLAEKLFIYMPCHVTQEMVDGTSPGLVLSSGGSLALVAEENSMVMCEYAKALVDARNSQNSSASTRKSLLLPTAPHLSQPLYYIRAAAKLSDIVKLTYDKPHGSLQFTFDPSMVNGEREWCLRFTSRSVCRNLLNVIKTCMKASNSAIEVLELCS